jgi:hypothetical protein
MKTAWGRHGVEALIAEEAVSVEAGEPKARRSNPVSLQALFQEGASEPTDVALPAARSSGKLHV